MSSGSKPSPEVKAICDEMRINRCNLDPGERLRLVILEVKKDIVMERAYRQKDLHGMSPFKIMMDLLGGELRDKCRYILYDCHYGTKECCHKEDLAFFMWAPSCACIKGRLCIASSENAIKPLLGGFKHTLQINDQDFNLESFVTEKLGPGVVTFEEEEYHCHSDHHRHDHDQDRDRHDHDQDRDRHRHDHDQDRDRHRHDHDQDRDRHDHDADHDHDQHQYQHQQHQQHYPHH